ncbi:uncharacterized protein N7473_008193 [Penicillium subrubescens]|uniref:Uncharacterized protein n=1 Tax=Penicillium subrubescens TaxID=1316194 RepID=A0A1Q5TKP0_9EURO|nr:uncharacterized protein N7473_008193 [Penicillium subrubescens]KAJ5891965.1 hypothetical protein N7473_008193 [Penicillium subrubescens]OKP00793.1 hypothetical protein PENSUB_7724 [Penicillium subrubescens]
MHFSTAAVLVALSSLGVTYAAPFANPQEGIIRRKVSYQVVNVDGESTSSSAPEIETVTETIKSVTTAPGAAPQPVTVTITTTATPSTTPTPSSTPLSHAAPPPGASFFPPPNSGSGFFRRGLMAAGDPLKFARGYDSSVASVTATPLVARGWYSSSVVTPTSSAINTPSLVARQFGSWASFSVATPSSSVSPSLAARQFDVECSSVSPSATPSSTALVSATPLVAQEFRASSSTPSSSWSIPASYTPLAARDFHNEYYPSASSSATPSSSFTLSPSANALLY